MNLANYEISTEETFSIEVEKTFATLLELISGETLAVTFQKREKPLESELNWFCLKLGESTELAVTFPDWQACRNKAFYFSQMQDFAKRIKSRKLAMQILPQFQANFSEDQSFASVQLHQLQPGQSALGGQAYFWLSNLEGVKRIALLGVGSHPYRHETALASVRLFARVAYAPATQTIKPTYFWLSARCREYPRHFPVQCEQGKFFFYLELHEEITMEQLAALSPNDSETICVDVCLGTLTLKLSEFMALRPGMKISFTRPEPFQSVIRVAEQDFALATVEFVEGKINLKLSELVGNKSTLSPNQSMTV